MKMLLVILSCTSLFTGTLHPFLLKSGYRLRYVEVDFCFKMYFIHVFSLLRPTLCMCVIQAFIVLIAVHPRLLSQLLSHPIKSDHTATLGSTSSYSLSLTMFLFPRQPALTERVLTPSSKALTNSEYSASYLKTQQPHTPTS